MEATISVSRGRSHSDLELVERHRHGDPDAFRELYERFSEMVYNLALRLCGDAEEAQDLTQEVFLRVFRGLGRFRGRSSLKTWVYRVCLNHCRSRLGRRRLPSESLPSDTSGKALQITDPRRGPEDLALAEDAGRRVAAALVRLDAIFREAVILRDIEDLAYKEIAEILGLRIGTVRSRIARGREQLRKVLEEVV